MPETTEPETDPYPLEWAMNLARLWRAGKLIGGDPYAVIEALLQEIERLTGGPPAPR